MIKRVGKKTKQWLIDRAELITQAVISRRIKIIGGKPWGICEDCKHWHMLTPDHKLKRSQGGKNDASNIEWICNAPACGCHNKRDNLGDPLHKKKTNKLAPKADWQSRHECKKCSWMVQTLICSHCGKISI